jgi:uncharacterized membrane protein YuzA (DUF378 family)
MLIIINNIYIMKSLHKVTYILVIVGALNWGLEALGFNLVNMLLGSWPMVERIVYLLVGVSAVYEVVTHKNNCRDCNSGSGAQM